MTPMAVPQWPCQWPAGKSVLLDCIDEIGDPSDVEVRIIPDRFYGILSFDQKAVGEDFHWRSGLDCDSPENLWTHCGKTIWPK
jgi:hypothetical protein